MSKKGMSTARLGWLVAAIFFLAFAGQNIWLDVTHQLKPTAPKSGDYVRMFCLPASISAKQGVCVDTLSVSFFEVKAVTVYGGQKKNYNAKTNHTKLPSHMNLCVPKVGEEDCEQRGIREWKAGRVALISGEILEPETPQKNMVMEVFKFFQ
jgi:hypothetical protein